VKNTPLSPLASALLVSLREGADVGGYFSFQAAHDRIVALDPVPPHMAAREAFGELGTAGWLGLAQLPCPKGDMGLRLREAGR